jgi:NADH-quinone oxidoreductase subunit D/NADH-quinone oxidoreductase subunit C/D
VPYDVRRAEPYSIYDRFDWDVVTTENGDVYDRYLVRVGEMRQSLRILQQALDGIPGGDFSGAKPRYNLKVPEGEAYGRIESPKGELGFYIISTGGKSPYRLRIRSPSFNNVSTLPVLVEGGLIADVIANIASLDPVMGEEDR